MPELWVRFESYDAEIMGDEYVDLCPLTYHSLEAALRAHGHKSFLDLIGYTPQEFTYLNEAMPSDMQRPQTPSDSPWTPAETGLSMCRTLPDTMKRTPQAFADWPTMIADTVETIEPFERVLARTQKRGVGFQTLTDF